MHLSGSAQYPWLKRGGSGGSTYRGGFFLSVVFSLKVEEFGLLFGLTFWYY